jgi:hypothetical protein
MTLSPAPGDLELAQISFRAGAGKRISGRSLQVAVIGPFGDDYLAAAAPRFSTARAARTLVLIVNRPSALLDPVHVRLVLTVGRLLGTPLVLRLADPFTRSAGAVKPALCDLPLHGSALRGSELLTLRSHGAALTGFAAASAVAAAYDVACGLPYASSFKQAVRQSAGGACPTADASKGALCCPANAICATPPGAPAPPPPPPPAPPPAPPVPGPPRCAPCNPPPLHACPLVLHPIVCAAPLAGGVRRQAAGAL